MNKILKISLSLLIIPIISICSQNSEKVCSEKSEKKITFHPRESRDSRGKACSNTLSPSASYTEKTDSEEQGIFQKSIENQKSESSKSLNAVAAELSEIISSLGTPYNLPTIIPQDKEFKAGMTYGYDSKGIRESAASFVHRLISAGKLLDASSKPDKLQSKEPKINERITEGLREIISKFNDEQKKAHASVAKLLVEQKANFTQSANSMLSILLTLNSIGISQVISGQDVETYKKNIEDEINSLKEESKVFNNEKHAQIQHLVTIQNKLNQHLEPISEKKESK